MKKILVFSTLLVFVFWITGAGAQMYHWIDENGVKRFSNEPPPEGAQVIEQSDELRHDSRQDRNREGEDQQTLNEVEQMRQRRRMEVDARAREQQEKEAAERMRIEAENARIEAEKKANRAKRYEKGTGEQKRRRRERAAQGAP